MTWFSLHEWRREEDTSLLSSSLEDFFSLLLYFRGSNLNSPPPLGMLLGGAVSGHPVQGMGIRGSLLIVGLCYSLTTASLLVNPPLRKMEKRRETSRFPLC
jgi:hypothetical protein